MPFNLENVEARMIAGQRQILADMLKKGIPLVYKDEKGNMVKKHPDGRIEVLKEADACR